METKTPRRPGRPPLGNRPFTAAEHKARYRDRSRRGGVRVFEVRIKGDVREKIEEIAKILEIPASEALRLCAEAGVGDMWLTALNVRDQVKSHDPEERRARKHIADVRRILVGAGIPVDSIDCALAGQLTGEMDDDPLADLGDVAAQLDEAMKALGKEGGEAD